MQPSHREKHQQSGVFFHHKNPHELRQNKAVAVVFLRHDYQGETLSGPTNDG